MGRRRGGRWWERDEEEDGGKERKVNQTRHQVPSLSQNDLTRTALWPLLTASEKRSPKALNLPREENNLESNCKAMKPSRYRYKIMRLRKLQHHDTNEVIKQDRK